jgi:hypothetical protein
MPETFVVIGSGQWGSGPTLDAAKRAWRGQGPGRLRDGYAVLTLDAGTSLQGVDEAGRVHWRGNRPAYREVPARPGPGGAR